MVKRKDDADSADRWGMVALVTGLAGFAFAPLWIITAITLVVAMVKNDKAEKGEESVFSDDYHKYFTDVRQAIEASIENKWYDRTVAKAVLNNNIQYLIIKTLREFDGHKAVVYHPQGKINSLYGEDVKVPDDEQWVDFNYEYDDKLYRIILIPKKGMNVMVQVRTKA